jgi:hypothetical protein
VVLLGLELVRRQRFHELTRHRALALGELHVLLVFGDEAVARHHFIRVAHRLDAEHAVDRPDGDESLLAADDDATDRNLVQRGHRVDEQLVRLHAALVGREVVRLFEVQRVDLVEVDEFLDLDRVAAFGLERLDLPRLHHHIPALGNLEPAHDAILRHFVASGL